MLARGSPAGRWAQVFSSIRRSQIAVSGHGLTYTTPNLFTTPKVPSWSRCRPSRRIRALITLGGQVHGFWRLRIMAWHHQLEIERTLASAEGTHGAKLRHRRKRRRRRIGRPNDIRHHSSPTSHPHSHSTHPAVITYGILPSTLQKIIPSPRNLFEHTGQGTIGALMINGAMGGEPVNKSRQTVT